MSYTVKELLIQRNIAINPKTAKELESRWHLITEMRKNIYDYKLADADICLVNTAGQDHINNN